MRFIDDIAQRVLVSAVLVSGTLLCSPFSYAAGAEKYYQFDVSQSVPELTVWHRETNVKIVLEKLQELPNGSASGQFFHICKGRELIKGPDSGEKNKFAQKDLASFMFPPVDPTQGAGSGRDEVWLSAIANNIPYHFNIPLRLPPAETIQTQDIPLAMNANPTREFAGLCKDRVIDGQENSPEITIPVRALPDATPQLVPLNNSNFTLNDDGKTFTATVDILGAVAGTKVFWRSGSKEQEMSAGADVHAPGNPAEVWGKQYSLSMPILTRMDETAAIRVTKTVNVPDGRSKKEESLDLTFPVVTKDINAPKLTVAYCKDTMCLLQWRSLLPYRDDKGSLEIKAAQGKLPQNIFALSPAEWESAGLTLFAGQDKSKTLSQVNWAQYQQANDPFLTSAPMPFFGQLVLRFEPVGAEKK